jgi:DNA primase
LGKKTGQYRRAQQHDSLVVNVETQSYYWNSRNEKGDVINWVMRRNNCDFKTAIELLCRRAGIPEPNWEKQTVEERIAARNREDAFEVAVSVFSGWLMRDETALNYALSRGWTKETIEKHMLGYTGKAVSRVDFCKHLRGEFVVSGVDPESPAAVSLIGFNGKVDGWLRANKLEEQSVWVEQGFIPSFVGKDMLVYPHFLFGRVRYYSGRGVQEKKHYNLPRELVGERQIYVNGAWKPNERNCVIVEGQADAISLAQLGIPAIASAGTSIDDSFRERMRGHITLYLGMDNDQAGAVGAWKNADILGPMTRLVKWPDGKDANDWLLSMVRNRVPEETQVDRSKKLLAAAPTYAEVITQWAGQQMGAERDDAQRKALAVVAKMDSVTLAQYRSKLAKAMDLNVRDFNHVLKTMSDLPNPDKAKEPTEFVETLGGWFDDTLIELLYDKESNYTKFAIRKPDGTIEEVDYYDYDNKRFVPPFPEDAMTKDVVMLPSKVVPLRSVRELIAIIRNFIHRYLDVDSF